MRKSEEKKLKFIDTGVPRKPIQVDRIQARRPS